jgi:hypothetical protein
MPGVTKLIGNIGPIEYQELLDEKIIPQPKFIRSEVHDKCSRPAGIDVASYGIMIEQLILDYLKGNRHDPMSIYWYQHRYPSIPLESLLGDNPMSVDDIVTILLPDGFKDYAEQITMLHPSFMSKVKIHHHQFNLSGEIDLVLGSTIMDIKTYNGAANTHCNYLQLLTYHAMVEYPVDTLILYNPLMGEVHMMDLSEKPINFLHYLHNKQLNKKYI